MDSIVPGHRSPHRQPEDLGSAETEARRCPGREPGPRPPLSSAGVGGGGGQRMSTADPSLLRVPGATSLAIHGGERKSGLDGG